MRSINIQAMLFIGLTGCGTINNTVVGTIPVPPATYTPPLEVYGGVTSDLRAAMEAVSPPYTLDPSENLQRVAGTIVVLADMPFSAVGDTLTLGKTIPASYSSGLDEKE